MEINIRNPDVDYKLLVGTTGECRDYGFMLNRYEWSSDAFKHVNKRITELNGGPGVLADVMDHIDVRRETLEDNYHNQLDICGQSFSVFLKYAYTVDRKIAAKIRVDTYKFQNTYDWAHPDFGKSFWQRTGEALANFAGEHSTELKIAGGVTLIAVLAAATILSGGAASPALVAALKGSVALGIIGTSAGAIYGGVTEGAEGAYRFGAEGLFLGSTIGATTGASLAATSYFAATGTGFWGSFWGSNLIGIGIRAGSGAVISVTDHAIDIAGTDKEFDSDYAKTLGISTGVSIVLDAAGVGIFRLFTQTGISRAAPKLFYTADELKSFNIKVPPGTMSQEAFFNEIFTTRLNSGVLTTANEIRYLQGPTPFRISMPEWFSNPLAGKGVNLNLLGFARPSLGTIGGRAVSKDDLGIKDIPDIFFFDSLMIDRSKSQNN